ncbi:MAG: hypothetical protein B6245_24310 [Desulfobacteraceae bacterium 4572_88]|nr:MAG: hypothetical protein B6245_24310 [Desulfobacteraceae bacterium 4572_88]
MFKVCPGGFWIENIGQDARKVCFKRVWVLIGSDQAKPLILKELFVYFGFKKGLISPFLGPKRAI